MQPGDLVKITRAQIGVPSGTVGLITKVEESGPASQWRIIYYIVQLCGFDRHRERRYLRGDLRPI